MEVILKSDVPNLGRVGEVVRVKNGYARNYLIPQSMAVVASSGQKRMLEHQKRVVEAIKRKIKKESEERADSFKSVEVKLKKRFNESGTMFGSVTPAEVIKLLEKQDHQFDKRDIELPAIKDAGDYEVKLRLPGDVYTTFKLTIEAQKVSEKKKKAAKKKAEDAAEGETAGETATEAKAEASSEEAEPSKEATAEAPSTEESIEDKN